MPESPHNTELDQKGPNSTGATLSPNSFPSGGSEQDALQRNQYHTPDEFFNRNCEERDEVVAGLLREGELGAFAGPYGMGKSPSFADISVRVINGLYWCGRSTSKRPVIVVDCETPGPDYNKAIRAISDRLGVRFPQGS
jgi:RecA-family ATPase